MIIKSLRITIEPMRVKADQVHACSVLRSAKTPSNGGLKVEFNSIRVIITSLCR